MHLVKVTFRGLNEEPLVHIGPREKVIPLLGTDPGDDFSNISGVFHDVKMIPCPQFGKNIGVLMGEILGVGRRCRSVCRVKVMFRDPCLEETLSDRNVTQKWGEKC